MARDCVSADIPQGSERKQRGGRKPPLISTRPFAEWSDERPAAAREPSLVDTLDIASACVVRPRCRGTLMLWHLPSEEQARRAEAEGGGFQLRTPLHRLLWPDFTDARSTLATSITRRVFNRSSHTPAPAPDRKEWVEARFEAKEGNLLNHLDLLPGWWARRAAVNVLSSAITCG